MSGRLPTKGKGDRWSRTPAHAIANRSLSAGTLRVLDAICIHVDAEGYAYPSQELLAAITGMRRETVCRAVRRLKQLGYLSRRWIDLPSGHRVRGYKVIYPTYVPPPSRYGTLASIRSQTLSDPAITSPVTLDADSDVIQQSP
jgi:hypothetical protein